MTMAEVSGSTAMGWAGKADRPLVPMWSTNETVTGRKTLALDAPETLLTDHEGYISVQLKEQMPPTRRVLCLLLKDAVSR